MRVKGAMRDKIFRAARVMEGLKIYSKGRKKLQQEFIAVKKRIYHIIL
jgi:hypothetical protein